MVHVQKDAGTVPNLPATVTLEWKHSENGSSYGEQVRPIHQAYNWYALEQHARNILHIPGLRSKTARSTNDLQDRHIQIHEVISRPDIIITGLSSTISGLESSRKGA